MDKTRLCIGIDLGTTNTSVAVSRLDNNGIVIVEDQEIMQGGSGRRTETIPSIMYVKDGTEYIGNKALDLKKNCVSSSTSVIPYLENTKRFIGTNKRWEIEGKEYSAIDVATKILSTIMRDKKIRDIADHADVCITKPAKFGPDQVNNTKEAAIRAGFKNVVLYDEPKAAVLSFLHEEKSKRENKKLDVSAGKRLLVVDIGGGTCDICVLDAKETANGHCAIKQLAINRDDLGGVDFDRKIAEYLSSKYQIGTSSSVSTAQLLDIGQAMKESMSNKIEDLVYNDYEGDEEKLIEEADWRKIITQAENVAVTRKLSGNEYYFELSIDEICKEIDSLIYDFKQTACNKDERDKQKNMEALINGTLEDYNVPIESIDAIFLTGGMSRCFALKAALFSLYHKSIICPDKPLLAVSRGAALLNKYDINEIDANNRMPKSIMLETDTGFFHTLIEAGQPVPVEKTVPDTFRTTSRTAVIIRLFEGKDEYDNQLRKLNNIYQIRFPEICELGREFNIAYAIDRSKQITFTVHFLDDGSTYKIEAKARKENE